VLEKGRGIGMALLSFIFIIGFGDAQYQGPTTAAAQPSSFANAKAERGTLPRRVSDVHGTKISHEDPFTYGGGYEMSVL
jgi:hypothetical protein